MQLRSCTGNCLLRSHGGGSKVFGALNVKMRTSLQYLPFLVQIGECIPPRTISLAAATFNLLVTIADLDITTFQVSFSLSVKVVSHKSGLPVPLFDVLIINE